MHKNICTLVPGEAFFSISKKIRKHRYTILETKYRIHHIMKYNNALL